MCTRGVYRDESHWLTIFTLGEAQRTASSTYGMKRTYNTIAPNNHVLDVTMTTRLTLH